ncbi:MAG: hypothetical protein KDE46_29040, partial [Caldilineaceae bacterium]|nr:hypothetical protein [Caldilineaceae bacterium]
RNEQMPMYGSIRLFQWKNSRGNKSEISLRSFFPWQAFCGDSTKENYARPLLLFVFSQVNSTKIDSQFCS